MTRKTILGILLCSAATWELQSQSLNAVQLADGTVYFTQPPSLVKAITTFRNPGVPATYYFTLDLPATAGEPLQRVTFKQQQGSEDIGFNLKHSEAEAEAPSQPRQKLNLGEVTSDPKSHTVSVTFDPPVSPGRTIIIGLHPVGNPLFGGVYLFGVIAFPVGEKVHGQFLGYGRLQFSIPSR